MAPDVLDQIRICHVRDGKETRAGRLPLQIAFWPVRKIDQTRTERTISAAAIAGLTETSGQVRAAVITCVLLPRSTSA